MEVSPKTLREVEFREKMRGYHPEDVDQFLEQVAAALEVMQDRLRQAVERAQRAEQAASDSGGSDETLRRTLVLAQRTADLAVQEAREQAARILAGAEQQAQTLLSEADERARRAYEDELAQARAEVSQLEIVRQQAQVEVEELRRWIDDHRHHVLASLQDAIAMVEHAGAVPAPPTSRPVDLPPPRSEPEPEASGPETIAWRPDQGAPVSPGPGEDPYFSELRKAVGEPGHDQEPRTETDPPASDQALDDFFEDDAFDDDRRLGGRLRRRR
ncbi:MAG: DivIVA domain-containing protein [Acidimicrobiales bacterium]